MKAKARKDFVRRAYTVRTAQDDRLEKWAGEIPGMDKSRVLRSVLAVGFATLKTSAKLKQLLGERAELIINESCSEQSDS